VGRGIEVRVEGKGEEKLGGIVGNKGVGRGIGLRVGGKGRNRV
jgi:hypothetical protein